MFRSATHCMRIQSMGWYQSRRTLGSSCWRPGRRSPSCSLETTRRENHHLSTGILSQKFVVPGQKILIIIPEVWCEGTLKSTCSGLGWQLRLRDSPLLHPAGLGLLVLLLANIEICYEGDEKAWQEMQRYTSTLISNPCKRCQVLPEKILQNWSTSLF